MSYSRVYVVFGSTGIDSAVIPLYHPSVVRASIYDETAVVCNFNLHVSYDAFQVHTHEAYHQFDFVHIHAAVDVLPLHVAKSAFMIGSFVLPAINIAFLSEFVCIVVLSPPAVSSFPVAIKSSGFTDIYPTDPSPHDFLRFAFSVIPSCSSPRFTIVATPHTAVIK